MVHYKIHLCVHVLLKKIRKSSSTIKYGDCYLNWKLSLWNLPGSILSVVSINKFWVLPWNCFSCVALGSLITYAFASVFLLFSVRWQTPDQGPGKKRHIPQPPRGQVVVVKSLVCPRGRVTRISIGRYIKYFLNRCFSLHSRVNS